MSSIVQTNSFNPGIPSLLSNALQRLQLTATSKKGALLPSLHHFNDKTGRTKQKRADRRGNIVKVLQVIVPEIHVGSLTWGQLFTNHKGETDLYTRGVEYISDKACMNIRTVCRALSDLEKAGYLKVTRSEGMGKEGKDIRFYSLRVFTHKFFRELGFKNKTIETAKSWKRKKDEIKLSAQKMTAKCIQGIGRISEAFKKHSVGKNKPYKTMAPKPQRISPTDTSNLLHKASEIASKTGRSPVDVYKELISKQ